MATTTNFGWETPDDTDLVKDGAAAMRTLGNAIDTSLVDLKGGTTGQVLSKASNTDMDFTWVAQDDSNAIQNAIVDAKGDIITATAADTPARLAVGTSGNILASDSSTATGLAYIPTFFAGKNKILNGDFNIWQRGTSFSGNGGFMTADRIRCEAPATGTASTFSQQSFAAGDITGYTPQFFARYVKNNTTAGGFALVQRIEDVRTLAGQTVTLSFWAKANASYTNEPLTLQNFGSGGSADVYTTYTTQTITTSWARYSMTFTMPSITGKTIGSSSFLGIYVIRSTASTDLTVDTWGWQLEAGSTATQFQTATGTIQGELAACQRYYFRLNATKVYTRWTNGIGQSGTSAQFVLTYPVQMRVLPTALEYSNLAVYDTNTVTAVTGATFDDGGVNSTYINATVASGLTQYRPYQLIANNNASAYIGLSAEL